MSASRAALLALVALALGATAKSEEIANVALRNLEPSGAFEVVNHGPAVRLAEQVRVERLSNGVWGERVADVRLVRACGDELKSACLTLAAGQSLRPPPWNGLSCGGQCQASCRANVLAPPGAYRFVLQPCGGSGLIHGPPFQRR